LRAGRDRLQPGAGHELRAGAGRDVAAMSGARRSGRRRAAAGAAALAVLAALASAPRAGARAEGEAPRVAATPADPSQIDAYPQGPGVAGRLEELRRRVQAALYYPPIARRLGLEGIAWVRFEIDREGTARDVDVARSSGHPILDRAARRTVSRA